MDLSIYFRNFMRKKCFFFAFYYWFRHQFILTSYNSRWQPININTPPCSITAAEAQRVIMHQHPFHQLSLPSSHHPKVKLMSQVFLLQRSGLTKWSAAAKRLQVFVTIYDCQSHTPRHLFTLSALNPPPKGTPRIENCWLPVRAPKNTGFTVCGKRELSESK